MFIIHEEQRLVTINEITLMVIGNILIIKITHNGKTKKHGQKRLSVF